ncbi:adenylate/guanylate cyclase domain-containing protein [Nocardioides sp. cx-173]|uniref:adenylate/guanylate cyclase domain-containing protein n=1 Tax=Nocardioides sp. cx-173 TaxID=2898796 RepID=UPI001E2BF06C|nr:adenylate/guanylate cyclase domain-containing protein [Nocardioides sp. cx-173]MCD4525298.1 adenylate/guanylate cyclase domain-containing protein [Nocardioides sp. cx-173]UGB40904.1 adenylate/guanylate cyclase domain-containing protein [Nocardioides sp. cx-173]
MGEEEEDSLEQAILREKPHYNAAEVAAEAGVSIDHARRLWRALGFPEHGGERAFTHADVEAVSTLIGAVDAGLFDFDVAVNLTRAVGQTMARLADWEVGALVHRVEELEAGEQATGTRVGSALRMVDDLAEPLEALLLYAWRRHVAAAVVRMEALGAGEEDLHTTQLTVGFADIVGFTSLSNQISREKVGDLVEVFESRCADVIATQRGRVIKSLGDSVLFVNTDALAAYDTAEGIINVIGRDPRMPDVRVGLASGSVVMRLGDVFGPPVNLAARLTAVARRNRIIVDAATADALPSDQFDTRRLPARPVRGFGLVEPLAVSRH